MTEIETKTNAILKRLPELQEGKMPPVDANLSTELVQAILKDGKNSIVGLIDALRELDNGSDWKTRFLLNTLVSAVGTPAQTAPRQMLATALLDEALGTRPSAVRAFLLGRLRLIADKEMVAKLIPLLAADDPPLADAAAAVLVSIGTPAKAPLAAALMGAQGRRKEVIENALAQLT
ncbi:MAG: hypothetical protein NTW21_25140 [Verrucomicrobia bacterium]|nr:hypothetical protein [Verrucomicrobiota bacterium]